MKPLLTSHYCVNSCKEADTTNEKRKFRYLTGDIVKSLSRYLHDGHIKKPIDEPLIVLGYVGGPLRAVWEKYDWWFPGIASFNDDKVPDDHPCYYLKESNGNILISPECDIELLASVVP
jgi:hypothetical protein